MMIGGENLKIGSDTSEGDVNLGAWVKNQINIIKPSVKVIEGDSKRFNECCDIKWSYDKLEAQQRDLVSQKMDLVKRTNTLERHIDCKCKSLDRHLSGTLEQVVRLENIARGSSRSRDEMEMPSDALLKIQSTEREIEAL